MTSLVMSCIGLSCVYVNPGRMQQVSRAFRLRWEERCFLEDVMNQAIAKVEKRDMKLCVEWTTNVFQLARREDQDMWGKGIRNSTRLAWLLAPESAYHLTVKYKTAMQDSQCNWDKASAMRKQAEDRKNFRTLVTVACMQ